MSDVRNRLGEIKFVGGAVCLDFANTGEVLADYEDLCAWLQRAGSIDEAQEQRLQEWAASTPGRAQRAFDRAASLRKTIHRIFVREAEGAVPEEKDLARLSAAVGRSAKHWRLRRSEERFQWGWSDAEDQLEWPVWILARSAADLLTSDERDRVRRCAGPDCGWLFVDISRNHSRRWCDMADCGNRAKARRSYARKRQAAQGP